MIKKFGIICILVSLLFAGSPGISTVAIAQQAVPFGIGQSREAARQELQSILQQLLAVGITIGGGVAMGPGASIVISTMSYRLAGLTLYGVSKVASFFQKEPPRTIQGIALYYGFLQQANQYLFESIVRLRKAVEEGRDEQIEQELAELEQSIQVLSQDSIDRRRYETLQLLLIDQKEFKKQILSAYQLTIQVLSVDLVLTERLAFARLNEASGGVAEQLRLEIDSLIAQEGMEKAETDYERQRKIHLYLQILDYQEEEQEALDSFFTSESQRIFQENKKLGAEIESFAESHPGEFHLSETVKRLLQNY